MTLDAVGESGSHTGQMMVASTCLQALVASTVRELQAPVVTDPRELLYECEALIRLLLVLS